MSEWPNITESILGISMTVFGTPFTFTPNGGQPENLTGVFDDEHEEVDLDVTGDAALSTHSPRIGVRISDFSIPPGRGDRIERSNISYEIFDVQRDGQGGTVLILHEVDDC